MITWGFCQHEDLLVSHSVEERAGDAKALVKGLGERERAGDATRACTKSTSLFLLGLLILLAY
jgi:hypothetical protein